MNFLYRINTFYYYPSYCNFRIYRDYFLDDSYINLENNSKCSIENRTKKSTFELKDEKKGNVAKLKKKDDRSKKGLPQISVLFVRNGFSCYLNSALQILIHTPSFFEALFDCYNILEKPEFEKYKMISHFYNIGKRISLSDFTLIEDCRPIKESLAEFNPIFSGYSQQDAHECFLNLLAALDKNLKENSSITKMEKKKISCLFRGKLKTDVECPYCGEKQSLVEPFRTLIINEEDMVNNQSLQSVIEQKFFKTKYKEFDICTESDTLKSIKTEIIKFPKNLVFYIKKSILKDYDKKIKFKTSIGKIFIYEPYAYVIRIPYSYDSGHYQAIIRSPEECYQVLNDDSAYTLSIPLDEFLINSRQDVMMIAYKLLVT